MGLFGQLDFSEKKDTTTTSGKRRVNNFQNQQTTGIQNTTQVNETTGINKQTGVKDSTQTAQNISDSVAETISSLAGAKTGVSETTQVQDVTQVTGGSLFGKEVQTSLDKLVQDLIPGANTKDDDGAISNLLDVLISQANVSQADLLGEKQGLITSARFQGEKELLKLQTRLAQEAGGSLANTGVVAATSEGRAVLEAELASLEADLIADARQESIEQIGAALNVYQKQTGSSNEKLTNLLVQLKGGESTQTATTKGEVSGTSTTAEDTTQTATDQQTTSRVDSSISKIFENSSSLSENSSISNLFSSATTEQQVTLSSLLTEIANETSVNKSENKGFKLGFKDE